MRALLAAALVGLVLGSNARFASTSGLALQWSAPFFSGGGYCSEAISMVQALHAANSSRRIHIAQHGDSYSPSFVNDLPRETRAMLQAAMPPPRGAFVSVCHSEPGAWHLPEHPQRYNSGSRCPAPGASFRVARSMFETDRLPTGWSARLNAMDEVWVPTEWARGIFSAGGVEYAKLRVLPEAVDTEFFSGRSPGLGPDGARSPHLPTRDCTDPATGALLQLGGSASCPFRFLAVGKFERRKGFDVLLRSLLLAFGAANADEATNADTIVRSADAGSAEGALASSGSGASVPAPWVELHILTSAYHSSADFAAGLGQMLQRELACPSDSAPSPLAAALCFGERGDARDRAAALSLPPEDLCLTPSQVEAGMQALEAGRLGSWPPAPLPRLRIRLLTGIPQPHMPGVYAAVDAAVQPSRGEGWGRPHVEAMASGLPLIATNWSGPAAFLNERNGYPLPFLPELRPIPDGAFAGHLQADPSAAHLAALLGQLVRAPGEAAARGAAAREDMRARFSPAAVGSQLEALLADIDERVGASARRSARAGAENAAGGRDEL